MATSYSAAANWAVATDAAIRDWAGRIEALLTAGGWVQSSDTGQTAAAALTAATAINQVRGYQIWRMADTLQATAPIFVKFEYASGSVATFPVLWVTIGTGSDGAGNLTGIILARTSQAEMVAQATTYFVGSAAPGRLCFYLGVGGHLFLSLERTKDSTGVDTSDGVLVILDSNGTAVSGLRVYGLLRASGTVPANSTYWGVFTPSGTTWALGSNVGVCPARFFDGQPTNPGIAAMVYLEADIAALTTPVVSIYGTAHTYFALGSTRISTLSKNSASTLMMLYE